MIFSGDPLVKQIVAFSIGSYTMELIILTLEVNSNFLRINKSLFKLSLIATAWIILV